MWAILMYFCPDCQLKLQLQVRKWNYNLKWEEVKTPLEIQTDTNGQILRVWDNIDCLNTTVSVSVFT